ncbi:hypothetical protein NON20_05140 [Synechocystis sp. B12]|nr:hypothetical protein NON20_05140 [Synechocystis sp. B12]
MHKLIHHHKDQRLQAIANVLEQWHFLNIWLFETLNTPIFKLGTESITLWWIIQACFLLLLVGVFAKATKQFLKSSYCSNLDLVKVTEK